MFVQAWHEMQHRTNNLIYIIGLKNIFFLLISSSKTSQFSDETPQIGKIKSFSRIFWKIMQFWWPLGLNCPKPGQHSLFYDWKHHPNQLGLGNAIHPKSHLLSKNKDGVWRIEVIETTTLYWLRTRLRCTFVFFLHTFGTYVQQPSFSKPSLNKINVLNIDKFDFTDRL